MSTLTLSSTITVPHWTAFDGIDAPEWLTEDPSNDTAGLVCSFLNSYIPREYSQRGCRYHTLNRYPSGRLYFHLLNRPTNL